MHQKGSETPTAPTRVKPIPLGQILGGLCFNFGSSACLSLVRLFFHLYQYFTFIRRVNFYLSASFFLYRYAFQIVLQIRDLLRELPSLVDINVPNGKHFTVCGDVHGQVIWIPLMS